MGTYLPECIACLLRAGTFAESFWKRVFDSVLLPIFDHVRAEVRRAARRLAGWLFFLPAA